MGENYVTQDECKEYRKECAEKIMNHEIRIVTLETTLEQLVSTCKMIAGSVIAGFITIAVILLTRGL